MKRPHCWKSYVATHLLVISVAAIACGAVKPECVLNCYNGLGTAKGTFWYVRPGKSQISLRIARSAQSLL